MCTAVTYRTKDRCFGRSLDLECSFQETVTIAPFEFIPWILVQCAVAEEAGVGAHQPKIDFSAELPVSPLHWIIADRTKAIVVEPMKEGMRAYDDPVGILTNNPAFDMHIPAR